MSDKQKGAKEGRSGKSRRRNASGDHGRRRTVSEKPDTRNRPKIELLPSIVMSSAYGHGSVQKLVGVEKGQNSRKFFEPKKSSSNPLCLTDCIHFLKGNCEKGNDCKFRHQESARNATIVCKFWMRNECTNLKCSFLHFKSLPLKHEKIQCHFEQREGGCRKADCDYLHELPRRSNSNVVSKHVTEALNNMSLSKESTADMCTKCGFCGTDLSGTYALKTGKLIYCLGCADMLQG